jgi:hypothetical protein
MAKGPGPHDPYGKDRVARGSEGFITEALTGGHGKSEGLHHEKVDRKGQSILTAVAMDNVDLALDIPSSIIDDERAFHGGTRNLAHSLDGAEAPADGDVGAAGPVDHVIIENH